MSKVKSVTMVCENAEVARLLAAEYLYIGRSTVIDGRFLTVTTH